MDRAKSNLTFERESDDAILSLGHSGDRPISSRTGDPVVECHYEITIEHWVRDDRSRRKRFRLVRMGLVAHRKSTLEGGNGYCGRGHNGNGDRICPDRAKPAVPAPSKGRSTRGPGIGSLEELTPFGVIDHL
jgi:hypothetical protein